MWCSGGVLCCLGSAVFGGLCLCSNQIKCENRGQAWGPLHHRHHHHHHLCSTGSSQQESTPRNESLTFGVDCRQLSLTPTRRGDTFTVRGGPERIVGEKNIISCRVQQLYKLLIMTFLSPGGLSDRLLWRKQAQELRQKWVQDFIEAPTKGLSQIIHQSADYSHY